MRNRIRTLSMAVLALAVYSSLTSACQTAPLLASPLHPSEIVADSVSGFSDKQGSNGWSYGYWDSTGDRDKDYNPTTDFQWLQHFGRDPINRLSYRAEFTTGKLWYLQDGLYYTSLWAEGGHANGTLDLGRYAQVDHWAVRRWVSTTEGPITIRGRAGKLMPFGKQWGGGCKARIVVDGKPVFATFMNNDGTDYSIHATVHVGSLVDFLIGPGPNVGVTEFTATIRAIPTLP
jgi:hypothetical protein